MAGFFGLFGGKAQYIDEIENSAPPIEEKQEAFFLAPDEAVSLGNVEFMRKQITTKRTFPKTLKGGGGELIQAVSAVDKVKLKKEGVPVSKNSVEEPSQAIAAVPNERRSSDNSLEMFRKMARDLKS